MMFTVDEIIEIHSLQIWRHGITPGVRDHGLLETLIEYRLREATGVFQEAAIVLYSIAKDHPFVDGNKRTAFVVAVEVLKFSGYYFTAENDEVVSFVLAVAIGEKTPSDIEKWLRESSVLRSDFAEPF